MEGGFGVCGRVAEVGDEVVRDGELFEEPEDSLGLGALVDWLINLGVWGDGGVVLTFMWWKVGVLSAMSRIL